MQLLPLSLPPKSDPSPVNVIMKRLDKEIHNTKYYTCFTDTKMKTLEM